MADHNPSEQQPTPDATAQQAQQAEAEARSSIRAAASRLSSPDMGPDDLIQVLDDFDHGLKALKVLHAERQIQRDHLVKREAELASREADLSSRQAQLDHLKQDMEVQRQRLDDQRRELDQARALAAENEGNVRREIKSAQDALSARASALDDRQAEEIRAVDARCAQLQQQVSDGEARIRRAAERMTALERELRAERETRETAVRELDETRAKLAETEARAASIGTELDTARTELARLQSALRDAGESAREHTDALTSHAQELESRAAALEASLKADREELAAARTDIERLKSSLRDAEAAGRLNTEHQQTRLRELEARAAALDGSLNTDRAELAKSRSEIAHLKTALSEAEQSGLARAEELVARIGELQARASLLEADLGADRAKLAATSDELRPVTEELARRRSEAVQADALIEQLKDRLRGEIERSQSLEAGAGAARERAADLERQIEQLATDLQAAQSRNLERAPSFGPSHAEDSLRNRRERIRTARRLLRDKTDRLRKGEAALQKRFEQCEQLLSQRAELAAAHTTIVQAQRKLQSNKARNRAGVSVLSLVGALAILGGMSWAVSREVVPGVYAARITVRAEGRGRELTSDELVEWQRYHEKLLKDPRLSDEVAERMKRKNIAALSHPAAVAARLKSDFSFESARDGEIDLELRGPGKEATERELDTIATAFASTANASRSERLDGGSTAVPTPANAGGSPIDQSQFLWAAGIMGAGTAILGVIALAIWKRLKNAKTQFERDTQLSAILDGTNWQDPRKPSIVPATSPANSPVPGKAGPQSTPLKPARR